VSDPILSLLYGGASGAVSSAATAIPALRRAAAEGAEAKALGRLSKDAEIGRAMQAFRVVVAKTNDLAKALRDPRVLGVLLPAMGMADAVGQPGLAARALTADPNDAKGLLARLSDGRWKETAVALDLHRRGIAGLRDPQVQAKLEQGLKTVRWHAELDGANPGVSDALYFRRQAASADGVYAILGNPVLRRVVTGALGLPAAIAVQPIETQARAVTTRLDLADLKDAAKVARLAERYVLNRATEQAAAGASGGGQSSLLALFA
jgi:hypothetical protein